MAAQTPRRRPAVVTAPAAAVLELTAALALLAAAAIAGVLLVHRPWPNRLDVWGFSLLPANLGSRTYHDVADLGSAPVFAAGILVTAAIGWWRDRPRALACLLGPTLAVFVTERIAKPLVGRHAVLGGSSYPSGTVTAVAALAVAVVLVSPRLLRPLSALLTAFAVLAVCAAVVGMRWHYPTDTMGGIGVGAGSVLLVDGLAHLPGALRSGAGRRAVPQSSSPSTDSGSSSHAPDSTASTRSSGTWSSSHSSS